jgi:TatD DNase family protein
MTGSVHPAVAPRPLVATPEPLPAPVVDAHTHLDACGCADADDVAAAMARAAAVGVRQVVTVADDLASARWAVAAAGWHPDLYAAVALHPTRADTLDDAARAELERLAVDPRVVAVGETGLDHYWDAAPHDVQREAFAWHIDLAKRVGKPLMIHDRDAHDDVLAVLREEGAPEKVIFHCFSGDVAMARTCADRLMVETDAPFLTPHPQRGRRNEPFALPYTVRALASIRGADLGELCRSVTLTTRSVYGLPDL